MQSTNQSSANSNTTARYFGVRQVETRASDIHFTDFYDDELLTLSYVTEIVRYVEGLGKETHGEKIVLEASSGALSEDVSHFNGDTLKLIQSATEILKAELLNNLDCSYTTFLRRKILIVQTVTNKMTLPSVSLLDETRYKVIELRSGNVPVKWEDRYDWMKIFELLSTVMVSSLAESRMIVALTST
jgi:hypothetical protein